MTASLVEARRQLIDRLAAALELQLRLLHSTEVDQAVIGREHDAFGQLLDRLIAHPQRPHIQRYSDLNRDEFTRAEYDYLTQFHDELQQRVRSVCTILLILVDPYRSTNSVPVLVERMLEPRRTGSPNQFSEAQRNGVLTLLEPSRYYGAVIAADHFTESGDDTRRAESIGPDRSVSEVAGLGDAHESEDDTVGRASAPSTETGESLLRLKASVLAENVRQYRKANEGVLAVAVLKVKRWLAEPTNVPRDRTLDGDTSLLDAGKHAPGLELRSADPKALAFSYTGENGTRALFSVGLSNRATASLGPDLELALLSVPNASVVFVTAAGTIAGSAYIASDGETGTPLEQLAMLIKRLDFAREFLRLTSMPSTRAIENEKIDEQRRAHLMKLAEAL